VVQHWSESVDDVGKIQHRGLQDLLAAEGKQSLSQRRRAIGGVQHVLQFLGGWVRGFEVLHGQAREAADDHQCVVEIVSDSTGEMANGLHLLRLPILLLERG